MGRKNGKDQDDPLGDAVRAVVRAELGKAFRLVALVFTEIAVKFETGDVPDVTATRKKQIRKSHKKAKETRTLPKNTGGQFECICGEKRDNARQIGQHKRHCAKAKRAAA